MPTHALESLTGHYSVGGFIGVLEARSRCSGISAAADSTSPFFFVSAESRLYFFHLLLLGLCLLMPFRFHMHLTSSHMYSTWLMLFYGKFHLLKTFFMDIGKDKRIVDFLAGVHGLGNACKLIFGNNILEHRTGSLVAYQTNVVGKWRQDKRVICLIRNSLEFHPIRVFHIENFFQPNTGMLI